MDEPVPPGQPRGRTGTEPATARSPLRLRFALAVGGGLFCLVTGLLVVSAADRRNWAPVLAIALLAAAAVAVVDAVVIARRLRAARGRR